MKALINMIRFMFYTNKVDRYHGKVEDAIRRKALSVANVEFHRTMGNFYGEMLMEIDPHQDWWGFANAKQKQHNHHNDFLMQQQRVDEGNVKVLACKRSLLAAQKVLSELPDTN